MLSELRKVHSEEGKFNEDWKIMKIQYLGEVMHSGKLEECGDAVAETANDEPTFRLIRNWYQHGNNFDWDYLFI